MTSYKTCEICCYSTSLGSRPWKTTWSFGEFQNRNRIDCSKPFKEMPSEAAQPMPSNSAQPMRGEAALPMPSEGEQPMPIGPYTASKPIEQTVEALRQQALDDLSSL